MSIPTKGVYPKELKTANNAKKNKDKDFARIGMKETITLCDDVYVNCKMHKAEGTYKVRQSTYDY